ncbi:hypothetical protein ACFLZZ_01210 [Nanoarchaeota archaeon]
MKKMRLLSVLMAFVLLALISIGSVEGTHDEALESYYRVDCHADCDSLNLAGGFDAECRDDCNTKLQELLSTHQEEEEEVIEPPTTPEPIEVIKETPEEEVLEKKEIEVEPGCELVENVKSCSFEGYAPFKVDSNAKITQKDGEFAITTPSGEEAILKYKDGSEVKITDNAFTLAKIGEKEGFFDKLKNLWRRLFGGILKTNQEAPTAVKG